MDLLLDSHALFWAIYKPERLSQAAADAIADPANATWATRASAQEIAFKLAVGKWRAALDLLLHFEERLAAAGYGHIAPTAMDYANLLRLPEVLDHRDPFDRLIVAQASARGMTLVTSDPYAPLYGVAVIPAGRGERSQEARAGRLVPVEPLVPIRLPDD